MGASKLLLGCLMTWALGRSTLPEPADLQSTTIFAAFLHQALQSSTEPSSTDPTSAEQSSREQSAPDTQHKDEKGAHRSGHRIQVPVEDSQPAAVTEAESAIEKRDYASAETLLRKYVTQGSSKQGSSKQGSSKQGSSDQTSSNQNFSNYVAWFDLGFVENALGKVDESITAYRQSVAAKPDVFESNLNLGLQLAKKGDPAAVEFLRAATQLKPTSHTEEGRYRAWLSLGQAIEKSRPEEAASAYREAAILQPKEIEPHLSAGRVLEQQNKFSDAEEEYAKALEIDPQSTDAVIGLANLEMRAQRFPEAEQYLKKLLTTSDSGPVHIQLGRVLAAEGKADNAVQELLAGLKLTPADESARRDLAELYATAGKNDLAEAEYRTLVAGHPDEAALHRKLGQALLRGKNYIEAQQEFSKVIQLAPAQGEGYSDLAFAASQNKDFELVIRALNARNKLLPENALTYFLRATACDHLHNTKDAAKNYHLFLKMAKGKYPDYEWQATHRLIAIEPKR